MIRRRGAAPQDESSSEEEDAFTAMSRKSGKRPRKEAGSQSSDTTGKNSQKKQALPISLTSSMKRHHKPSDTRKAKMDALLQELEAEKKKVPQESHRSIPEKKKGSFVEPSEEHLTTNIFVGNLAPSITEESLTELFLQFGDLYSVKIMWPRTPAERSRNRNTGFVCFMNRDDAEEAIESCNETDPFNVGRLLMMRWGKNVKKIVKRGTGGGIAIAPIRKKVPYSSDFPSSDAGTVVESPSGFTEDTSTFEGLPRTIQMIPNVEKSKERQLYYQPELHETSAVRVEIPSDPDRCKFISTVASFVAKDGSVLERRLIELESGNPLFKFLTLENTSQVQKKEHIFYRWRVYSFCQGDSLSTWRTEPFIMFYPNGRFWIPPAVNQEAARQEQLDERNREESMRLQKKQRRRFMGKREYLTGRQLERARASRRKGYRRGPNLDGGGKLTADEMKQFNDLVIRQLSVSRGTICSAMAFCFEKSGAAKEIAVLLKGALTDATLGVTVDRRIARLYLMSDILFNSQQPGVRNAFLYRDAVEKMAPDIFTSLGKHGGGSVGRMTMNKLRTAVSSVLGAWTDWSVYNPTFLDELQARFEGREVKSTSNDQVEEVEEKPEAKEEEKPPEPEVITDMPRGDWTEVHEDEESNDEDDESNDEDMDDGESLSAGSGGAGLLDDPSQSDEQKETRLAGSGYDPSHVKAIESQEAGNNLLRSNEKLIGEQVRKMDKLDSMPVEGDNLKRGDSANIRDVGLHKLDSNKTGRVLNGNHPNRDVPPDRGTQESKVIDGESVDGEDIGGEDIDGEDIDGEDIDGEDIDGENIDGDPVDGEDVDGDSIDGEDVDGDSIDGEDIDGDSIDGEEIDGQPL